MIQKPLCKERLFFLYCMMQKPIPDLTYKVIAYQFIDLVNWDEAIDWAYEMLQVGYDTPNLLILASITKPSNQYEIQPYLDATLGELDILDITEEAAFISYCYYSVKRIAAKMDIKANLRILCDLWSVVEPRSLVMDFWQLNWAWEDLDYGFKYQGYWPGATKDNIEQIAIETAQNWLKEHENQLNTITIG